MELKYNEELYEVIIPLQEKQPSSYQTDEFLERHKEFNMRNQRKRLCSRKHFNKKRNSVTNKGLIHEVKIQSDPVERLGEVERNNSDLRLERLSANEDSNTSADPRRCQQRLSWGSCETCRRKQESCETKQASSRTWKIFTNILKLKMVRLLGKLLMFMLLASCGGVLMSKVLTVDDQFAAQLLNSDIYQEIRLRPVNRKDFRKQLSETKSYYDVLRIFFDRKSISDKEIDELLMARTLKRIPAHVQLREIYPSEDYPDETYQDYGDYALQDPGTSVLEDIHRAYDHLDEMERSPLRYCHTPQPEITPVRGEGDSKHKLYYPECTVVHRCRNVSGCCPNSSTTCGPKSIEIITKSFFVVELTGVDQVQPNNVQLVETRDFINHTECECQEIKGLPGCDQECPAPFTRMRPGLKCTCDCLEENEGCLEIKRGHKSLDEETLMKIKDKTYMEPQCEEEVFDIKTGYCPKVIIRHAQRYKGHRNKGKKHHHKNHHRRKNQKDKPVRGS